MAHSISCDVCARSDMIENVRCTQYCLIHYSVSCWYRTHTHTRNTSIFYFLFLHFFLLLLYHFVAACLVCIVLMSWHILIIRKKKGLWSWHRRSQQYSQKKDHQNERRERKKEKTKQETAIAAKLMSNMNSNVGKVVTQPKEHNLRKSGERERGQKNERREIWIKIKFIP